MSVNTNVSSLVALRTYAQNQQAMNTAMERLATGKRINRAKDDPSGLIAADNLAAINTALKKNIERSEIAITRLSAEEGALAVLNDMAVELEGLVVQSANTAGLTEPEREAIQEQVNGVLDGFEFILGTSVFNGERIFKGDGLSAFGSLAVLEKPEESGAGEPGGEPAEPKQFLVTLADLRTGRRLNLVDGDLEKAAEMARQVNQGIAGWRSRLGNLVKFHESQIRQLSVELENSTSAESLIRDADIAEEVSNLVRSQVLAAASLKAIGIANQNGQNALALLG